MAASVFKNCRVALGGQDISGDLNSVKLDYGAEAKDITPFNAATKKNMAGLKEWNFDIEGYVQMDADNVAVEDALIASFNIANTPLSVIPSSGAAGDRGYFAQADLANYKLSGSVGDVYKFTAQAQANGDLFRGLTLDCHTQTTDAAAYSGAILPLAGATSQTFYAVLQVANHTTATASTGASIVASGSSLMGAPVTQYTFNPSTTLSSGRWAFLSSAITPTSAFSYVQLKLILAGSSFNMDIMSLITTGS